VRPLELRILPEVLAVCRLEPSAPVPPWAERGAFRCQTRTATELSIVCSDGAVPPGVASSSGWRAIAVAGTLDFALTGILASLAEPLAAADISIFVVSTYDTDYLLVKDAALARSVEVLTAAGHRFLEFEP
jgi:hypothetical protein